MKSSQFKLICLSILIASVYSCETTKTENNLTQFVDPFIGTQGRGNLYPGATVPFGMVQLSPDNTEDGELSAGYQYNFKYIHGFSHTHLSGTGIGDLTDLLIMPTTGILQTSYDKDGISGKGYQSKVTKTTEKATPGYYSVFLDDYGIQAELTATERCGFHKYTFQESDSAHIVLDLKYLNNQRGGNRILESEIKFENDSTITGYRIVSNWAPHRYFYFAARFSKPFKGYGISVNDTLCPNLSDANGNNLKAWVNYSTAKNEEVYIKVGISSVSAEGAMRNLEAEIPDWNFEKISAQANESWNDELMKGYAEFGDSLTRTMYYTSLYRTMLAPVYYCDVDSSYRGSDNQIHKGKHTNYHIFSLWDTFRALHPLMTITQPDRVNDLINSMLAIYKESGYLPVWHFGNGENNCMIGFHSMPVIADAYMKGFDGFDANLALEAMLHDIHGNGLLDTDLDNFKWAAGAVFQKGGKIYGAKLFHKYGYIPGDIANAAVSRSLEYSLNCYNVYQLANSLNNDTASYYKKCSNYYKNVYDPAYGFMRGRYSTGEFRSVDFDPVKQDHGWNVGDVHGDYVEGSGWQWLWFAPHNISGLISLMGGNDSVANKLDAYFDPSTQGEETAEATGYIGQHAQGNEPGHHTPYIYNYVGQPWKTQKIVHDLMTQTYHPTIEGLSGNDDCGQMSAWYVFSALGFYPVNPSGGLYVFGTPLVKYARIPVKDNKFFEIVVDNFGPENIYIQQVTLNNEAYQNTWISHDDIMKGGKLVFKMGNLPNTNYGNLPTCFPPDNLQE